MHKRAGGVGAYPGNDKTFIKGIHKKFGSRPLKSYPIIDVFVSKLYYTYILGMKVFKPLDHGPYVKSDAEELLAAKFGWKKFKHKHHESRFTRFFEDYWLPRKFGFDRRKVEWLLQLSKKLSHLKLKIQIMQRCLSG